MTEYHAETLLRGAKAGNLTQVKESWMKVENRYETDYLGHNALTLAIIHDQFEVFQFLVDAGANLDIVNNVYCNFVTLCGTSKVRYLREFQGSDSFLGATALICAVKNRDFRVVQYLVEKGASVNLVDQEGHSALYYAILKRCDREMIEYLIRFGSNLEQTSQQIDEYASFHKDFAEYWRQLRRTLL